VSEVLAGIVLDAKLTWRENVLSLAERRMEIFGSAWLGLIYIWRAYHKGFGSSIEGEAL
jgi:hypothetical protein